MLYREFWPQLPAMPDVYKALVESLILKAFRTGWACFWLAMGKTRALTLLSGECIIIHTREFSNQG